MPRITVKDKELVVCFVYGTAENPYNGRKWAQPATEFTGCKILRGDIGVRDDDKEVVGWWGVTRSPEDRPNRKEARKQAMEAVIGEPKESILTRDERTAIWSTIRK